MDTDICWFSQTVSSGRDSPTRNVGPTRVEDTRNIQYTRRVNPRLTGVYRARGLPLRVYT